MNKALKKFSFVPLAALLLGFAAVILISPERYSAECLRGFCVWAESVLPCLFPFAVISMLLIKTGIADRAFSPLYAAECKLKLPRRALSLFLLSLCCGYPAGSKILCDYRQNGLLSESECKILAPLCSTAGPLFILGTVGQKAFGGNGAGVKLLFACVISVFVPSILYALTQKNQPQKSGALPVSRCENPLYDAFYGALTAVCLAGGFIAFFFTLSAALADLQILSPLAGFLAPIFGGQAANGFCKGAIEATGGCFEIAAAGGFFALPLCGFLITFGGASILAQQLCYLNKCGVKSCFFILFKFLQGALCFGVLCLLNAVC